MAFFDLFRSKPRTPGQPATPYSPPGSAGPAPVGTGGRRFDVDRDRMFSLEQTHRLVALFDVPAESRGDAWHTAFYDAAWYASISVPEPAYFDGPDGFPYWRLDIPHANSAFDSQSLGNLARGCVERNAGAAFFASPGALESDPRYVLSMGMLDSLLRYDSPDGDPIDREETAIGHNPAMFDVEKAGTRHQAMTVTTEHKILTGSPNADFLPPYTARALHRYMSRIWGIEDPRVHLMVDHNMRPSRNLVIGRKHSSFASEAELNAEMQRLFWFLPRYRTFILMPEEWTFDKMDRLEGMF